MTSLVEHLSQYAAYHRDRRNIASHFLGVPMIVVAICILLSRPGDAHSSLVLATPAGLAALLATGYYLRLDLRYGLILGCLLLGCAALAHSLAALPTAVWLGWGLGLFALGWVIQLVGHYFEGRKPAFVDDIVGLLIGPVFVVAELGFLLGFRRDLEAEINARAGLPH